LYKILANSSFPTNNVHYLPSCHSTNEIANSLLLGEVEEGTIVLTDDQSDGKGQSGNQWHSEPYKNLTFSIVLKPDFLKAKEQFGLTVVISLAIKNLLDQYLPGEAMIKWPNDVYFKRKKVSGILIENSLAGQVIESTVVGIGLNVNQLDFGTLNATSMAVASGSTFVLKTVLTQLVEEISENYDRLRNNDISKLTDEYHKALYGLGEKREFKTNTVFTGEILGTDAAGRLIIESEEARLKFLNKEVEFLF